MKSVTSKSITIDWQYPPGIVIDGFIVEMKEAQSRKDWTKITSRPIQENTYTASGLRTKGAYVFRVAAKLPTVGCGEYSEISDPISCEQPRGIYIYFIHRVQH
jgi:hypothetical protein